MSERDPERAERELEELLRRLPRELPDPARRAEARRAFLEGRSPAGGPSRVQRPVRTGRVMADAGTGVHEDELNGFVAWLATHPPAAPPRTEFRRRARLAFLSAVASAPPPLRTRRSFRRLVWVAAAAAILAVTFLLPQPERWRAQLDGRLSFDRADYTPGDEARLAAAFRQAGTLAPASSSAMPSWSALAGQLLAVPPLPSLDGVEPVASSRAAGLPADERELSRQPDRGAHRHGGRRHAHHHRRLVDRLGTCVCVAEGAAHVTSARLASGFQDVGARSSLRVYSDPAVDPKTEAFPADDSGAEASHTGDLVQFLRGP
jgi:hypothetical protein